MTSKTAATDATDTKATTETSANEESGDGFTPLIRVLTCSATCGRGIWSKNQTHNIAVTLSGPEEVLKGMSEKFESTC
jgi:hypothetical protein